MGHHISRREFAAFVATGAAVGRFADPRVFGQTARTAADIIARIRKNVGVDWKAETVDGLKVGSETTRVTGIATSSMATMTVLQQAVKAGANLIVTFEPTFFSRSDSPAPPAGRGGGRGAAGAPGNRGQGPAARPPDPVFTGKNAFLERHGLVVYRFSDHWRARTPDPLAQGLTESLGWTSYRQDGNPARLTVPATTLGALAATIKKTLQLRGGIRAIGDPQSPVRQVALLPGSTPIQASVATLPGVDVIVAGEVREWESTEYVRDTIAAGQRKGMILLGRAASEEPSMALCATWLRTFVPEVPVHHVSAGDPYWRPA